MSADGERPLAGIRVLDLTRVVAGPHCTRMLAELGADVIKVEPPDGDQTRAGRGAGHPSPPGFVQLNKGKRLVALDLSQEEGRDLLRGLVGAVDVLVENFRPGVMRSWGLDHPSIAADHPGLVYVSISGYGQTGEWRERRAYAPFVHGEAGYLDTAAMLRDEPIEHDPMSIADLAAAKDATIAVLAALMQRGRTGRGQHVDISLAHSILYLNEFAAGLLSGATAPRSGSTAQVLFRTSDGVTFSGGNPVSSEVFATMCRCFGRPELIEDPRFVDSGARREHRAELLTTLQDTLLGLGGIDEVQDVLEAAGLTVGRVRRIVDVPDTPWVRERDAVVVAAVDGAPDVTLPSVPWRFSGAVDRRSEPLGAFGSANEEVLGELLGLDAADVEALHRAGVLRRAADPVAPGGAP